ncbi:MAG TPA: sensor histidine kinase [Clostridiaceae bacterium]|nr:sensor histidine kinase [Clostridiaceae bacterium]
MRISIKIKFSAFLAALLMLTVLVLSLFVLRGIRVNQKSQYETYLSRQAQTANIYFLQTLLAEENKVPDTFLENKGEELALSLEMITGQLVSIYDREGNLVSRKIEHMQSENTRETLQYALDNKTAYLVEDNSLYYLTPLKIADDQVGVVQLYYSLQSESEFYDSILKLMIYAGFGVFILSFVLAYYYFSSFAGGIMKLNEMVKNVREGNYETEIIKRRDEIGDLSIGISEMSGRIRKTILDMEEEQIKLSSAVSKLSLLDRQQKSFIGSVTHEFKTPLTSIKAYLDLLDMYPDDLSLLETAKKNIESETGRLYDMVEKVLKLAVTEKYDFEYNRERLDVKELILSITDILKGKMDKFSLSLETDLSEAYIEADRDSMTLILLNLLDNAIKYNKTRGSISVKSANKDGHVVLDIADTGIGIPEDLAAKIFEPFFTVDKNRSRENGGVGLGLSLAEKYTEVQGGSLSLLYTGPEGTAFRLIFPAS